MSIQSFRPRMMWGVAAVVSSIQISRLSGLLFSKIKVIKKLWLRRLRLFPNKISSPHTFAPFQKTKVNVELNGSCGSLFLAVWTDLIGKTPHFLLWFWCDVSLALTPSWTLSEPLGIERLIGVFELGDLIECSCHNISNTVHSPIMTQLGHDGHIPKKTTREKKKEKRKKKSTSSAVKWFIFSVFSLLQNLPLRPPL